MRVDHDLDVGIFREIFTIAIHPHRQNLIVCS